MHSSSFFAPKSRRAFTLIELLVVIAIIAILASILFPVFGRARENARRSSCQSNMKQIGLGILQYQQDYDEKMPGRSMGSGSWRVLSQPYLKSTQIFACPSNTDNSANGVDVGENALGVKRSYNAPTQGAAATGVPPTAWLDADGRAIAQFNNPSSTIMVVEGQGGAGYSDYPLGNTDWAWSLGTNTGQGMFAGHLTTVNVLFVDGHVKSLKPLSLINEGDGVDNARKNLFSVDNTKLSGTAYAQVYKDMAGAATKFN